jgi:diguanylate cyclase (GGDEF)-like protein
MTGLLNRREFLSQVETEWQRCQRHQRPLSLVSLDIDNFKSINDNYGHNAGDEAIILIAKLCNGAKRASDIAGRLGGEEFAILLPETKIAEAFTFAERLRTIIATETHGIIDGNVSTTVSIGLSITPEAASISEFFKQADTALYEAKRTGRNRVCCYGELQNANLSYE